MESKVVIKEEQQVVPPGFSPNQETRHGDAATTSSSAAAFGDGNEPGGPSPIEPDSIPMQNPIEDMRHQGSSSTNSAMNSVKRKRKPVFTDSTDGKAIDEGEWRRQFRSNLKKMISFFNGVKLRQVHLDCLKKTPFYHFVLPFAKRRITPSCVKGTQKGTTNLLMTYDKQQKAFVIGGKNLTITPEECDLILGITSGSKDLNMRKASVIDSSLAQRKFMEYKTIKPKCLKDQLLKYIESDEQQDIEDTVRIIILHLMSNVLFVASGDVVNWWMFRTCDKLDALNEYNWGKGIVGYFMKYVDKKPPSQVRGCTILFQYWMCERTTLVQPTRKDAFPRFRKWDLENLKTALQETEIKDILPEQVKARPITQNTREQSILTGQKQAPCLSNDEVEVGTEEDIDDINNSSGIPDSDDMDADTIPGQLDATPDMDVPYVATATEVPNTVIQGQRMSDTDDDTPLTDWRANYPAMVAKINEQEAKMSVLEEQLAAAKQNAESWRYKNQNLECHLNRLSNLDMVNQILEAEIQNNTNLDLLNDDIDSLKLKIANREAENTIDAIKAKHGNIDEDCILGSEWVRKRLLICICNVLKALQKKRVDELDIAFLEHYYEVVRDVEKFNINVKWLLQRLEKIKDAISSRDEAKVLTNEKRERMKKVEEKRRELQRLNSEVDTEIQIIEQLNEKISNRTMKFKEFQDRPMIDGLI